jgi:hypothetical protein
MEKVVPKLSQSVDPSRLKYFNALKMNRQEIQNKISESKPEKPLSPPTQPLVDKNSDSTDKTRPMMIQNSHMRKRMDDDEDHDRFTPPHLTEKETSFSLVQHERKRDIDKHRNQIGKRI